MVLIFCNSNASMSRNSDELEQDAIFRVNNAELATSA